MSIWNGVKRAFGFSPDDEDEDYAAEEYASTAPADLPEASVAQPGPNDGCEPHEPAGDPTLPADLFDAVLAVFNSAQPDFIRKCISTDAQREYLLGALSEKLRSRLSRAVGTEAMAADEELRAQCGRMAERVAVLEEESKAADRLRQENKKLRLSIENQKRALQDRINDLEAQAARRPDNAAKAKADARIAELEAEVEELRSRPEPEPMPAPAAAPAGPDPEILAMTARELHRQTQLREQAEMKSRMADHMVSDLRNRVAATREELEQNHAEQNEAMVMIEEKFDEFEQLKKRLESRIAELQEALKEERREDREARITKLNEENASLRHTIENNLYNQANSEMRLRKEIKSLKEQLEAARTATAATAEPAAPAYAAQPPAPAPRRRGRPKKSRIDPELSSTDWYAPESEAKPRAAKDDPDFGYHEPARRPSNDNEAQLSLF